MNIIVLFKPVPDLVEELEVNSAGTDLDRSYMKFILSEYDDHALEQALLIKEQTGGTVKVFAPDMPDVDDMLFAAIAKGADSVVKIQGDSDYSNNNRLLAQMFKQLLEGSAFDLILTGVQAIDDLDGSTGAMLASYLGLPYVGVVSAVGTDAASNSVIVKKEYPGGVLSELAVTLPAVIGIQSAEKPPRYVPIARIRQAMKTSTLGELASPSIPVSDTGFRIRRMYKPENTEGAEILTGSTETVITRLVDIFEEHGLLR